MQLVMLQGRRRSRETWERTLLALELEELEPSEAWKYSLSQRLLAYSSCSVISSSAKLLVPQLSLWPTPPPPPVLFLQW